jgi:predicted metalloprotease with PDZ domain
VRFVLLSALALLAPGLALAAATPSSLPPLRDADYPAVIDLSVDVSDIDRRLYRIEERIADPPPGPLTLSLPKWIPGEHSPSSQIALLSGLVIEADGKPLAWRRDSIEMTAFHVDVPKGSRALVIRLVQQTAKPGGPVRIAQTPNLVLLKWTAAALYPAGYPVSRIRIRPRLVIPSGWTTRTALDEVSATPASRVYRETDFETLMDSPVYAGRWERSYSLDEGQVPVALHVFGETEAELEATPDQIGAHRALVREADALFGGARPFRRYDFLLSLNPEAGYFGAEHGASSENGYSGGTYFSAWSSLFSGHDILAHEFAHAWNGKKKRPASLYTRDYTEPMGDDLLWVYEGLTEYWGDLLATRAGLFTQDQMRGRLAVIAANAAATPGRRWRSLADTTNAWIIPSAGDLGAASWQRGLDYYEEGQLVWLEADQKLRALTHGRKGLDDFGRTFFGGLKPGPVETYDEAAVFDALNRLAPYDWRGFFHERLDAVGAEAPLEGLRLAGWRLAFAPEPTPYLTAMETAQKTVIETWSIGLQCSPEGEIGEILWDGPAFAAGLVAGDKIVKVGAEPFTPQRLRAAIAAAAAPDAPPVTLTIAAHERERRVEIPYRQGLRYPHLERIVGAPDRLGPDMAPRALPISR